MKKITLLFISLMFLGGVTFAHGDKSCCKKGDTKKECAKEKKEACAKGEGCCSKDKKAAVNEKDTKPKTKQEKKEARLAAKANN